MAYGNRDLSSARDRGRFHFSVTPCCRKALMAGIFLMAWSIWGYCRRRSPDMDQVFRFFIYR